MFDKITMSCADFQPPSASPNLICALVYARRWTSTQSQLQSSQPNYFLEPPYLEPPLCSWFIAAVCCIGLLGLGLVEGGFPPRYCSGGRWGGPFFGMEFSFVVLACRCQSRCVLQLSVLKGRWMIWRRGRRLHAFRFHICSPMRFRISVGIYGYPVVHAVVHHNFLAYLGTRTYYYNISLNFYI